MSKYQYYSLDRPNNNASINNVSGNGFIFSAKTGTIAAGLVANSGLFGVRVSSSYRRTGAFNFDLPVYLERVRLTYTCLTAFSTPIVAGRCLELCIFNTGGIDTISGGLGIFPTYKGSITDTSPKPFPGDEANYRIAETAGIVAGGFSFSSGIPFGRMILTSKGNAGDTVNYEFKSTGEDTSPIGLSATSAFFIRNPQAMDAGGTFELDVEATFQYLPESNYPLG